MSFDSLVYPLALPFLAISAVFSAPSGAQPQSRKLNGPLAAHSIGDVHDFASAGGHLVYEASQTMEGDTPGGLYGVSLAGTF